MINLKDQLFSKPLKIDTLIFCNFFSHSLVCFTCLVVYFNLTVYFSLKFDARIFPSSAFVVLQFIRSITLLLVTIYCDIECQ